MKLKWVIVLIGVEFLALLYVLHLLNLLDLKTGITLGLVEMGVAILAWLLNEQSEVKRIKREDEMEANRIKREKEIKQKEKLEEEEAEKKEKLEEKMIFHSKELANKELKPITRTRIDFCFDGRLCIIEQKSSSDESYEDYLKAINAHLEYGYPELWKHKTNSDFNIENHNKLLHKFCLELTNKILNEIKLKIPLLIEWDGNGQVPNKHFNTKYILSNVQGIIQSSYDRIFEIDSNCDVVQDRNIWKVIIDYKIDDNLLFKLPIYQSILDKLFVFINGTSLAESDIKDDMAQVTEIVRTVLKDAFTRDIFSKIKEYKKDAETEYGLFLKGIITIIKNIENNIPLKDKCEICKNYY